MDGGVLDFTGEADVFHEHADNHPPVGLGRAALGQLLEDYNLSLIDDVHRANETRARKTA